MLILNPFRDQQEQAGWDPQIWILNPLVLGSTKAEWDPNMWILHPSWPKMTELYKFVCKVSKICQNICTSDQK